ncbi:MAG: glycosyltransferase family 39 protein [Planctomycetota bacterium]
MGDVTSRRLWIAAVALCVVFGTFCRFGMLGDPFGNDAGLYVGMGKVWVDGGQVYEDLWDTKLPGVVLLGGLPYAIFGSGWWGYLLTLFLLGTAAAWLLAVSAQRLAGQAVALPTFVVAMVVIHHPRYLGSGFQIETPQVFFASLAAVGIATILADPRRSLGWSLLVGIGAGLAAMTKPTGLSVAAGYAIALSVMTFLLGTCDVRRWLQHGFVALGGIVLVTLGVAVWAWAEGMLPYMPFTWEQISLYGSGTPWSQVLVTKVPVLIALPLLPAIGLLATRVFQRSDAPSTGNLRPAWIFALTWFCFEVIGVVLQKRAYSYGFLPIVAPASLLAGLAWQAAAMPRLRLAGVGLPMVAVAGLAGVMALQDWRFFANTKGRSAVTDYVRANSDPTDTLYGDNTGRWCVLADRPPGARLGMMIHLINHDDAPKLFMDELLADLDERKPPIVVRPIDVRQEDEIARWEAQPILRDNPQRRTDYRDAWNRYLSYLDTHYVYEADFDGMMVLRRKP